MGQLKVSEAIKSGSGIWIVSNRDELQKLQRKISAYASQSKVKVKSRSFVSIDQSQINPEVFYTVTCEVKE